MKYDLVKPCPECPFRRADGAIRLRTGRIEEICDYTGHDGRAFACHKTVDYESNDDDDETYHPTDNEQHCVGALIFGLKNNGSHQMARIAGRLGMWTQERLEPYFDEIFDDVVEMKMTSVERAPRR